jgi:hypothetical protein
MIRSYFPQMIKDLLLKKEEKVIDIDEIFCFLQNRYSLENKKYF